MAFNLSDHVQEWTLCDSEGGVDYNKLDERIDYLARTRFIEYLPTCGPHPDFRSRLSDWLEQMKSDEDRKLLLRLVPELFFVQRDDIAALYRAAMRGPIFRWLIDLNNIAFDDRQIEKRLKDAIRQTWFCPITDSLLIAEFYHVNNIEGVDYRPDWRSLNLFGKPSDIVTHMADNKLKQIVLLEDFVGSGSQVRDTIESAARLSPDIPVLVIPLIVCPIGADMGRRIARQYKNMSFCPIVTLKENMLLNAGAVPDEPEIFSKLRNLVVACYPQVKGKTPGHKYGPFGFNDTGTLIVTYSNCPDNTLPIIHYSSDTWKPIFPRASRL